MSVWSVTYAESIHRARYALPNSGLSPSWHEIFLKNTSLWG